MRNIRIEVSQVVIKIDVDAYVDAGSDPAFTTNIGITLPLDSITFLIEEFIETELGINVDYE